MTLSDAHRALQGSDDPNLPTCYLDVDGVVLGIYDGCLQLRPRVHNALREISKHARIVWCTTWGEEANLLLPAIIGEAGGRGNLAFPVLHCADLKVPAILEAQKGNPNWFWFEDGLTPDDAAALCAAGCYQNYIAVDDRGPFGLDHALYRAEDWFNFHYEPTAAYPKPWIPPLEIGKWGTGDAMRDLRTGQPKPKGPLPTCFLDVDQTLVHRDPKRLQLAGWTGSFVRWLARRFNIVWATCWRDTANMLLPALTGNSCAGQLPHVYPNAERVYEYMDGSPNWIWVQDGWHRSDLSFLSDMTVKHWPDDPTRHSYRENLIPVSFGEGLVPDDPYALVKSQIEGWLRDWGPTETATTD